MEMEAVDDYCVEGGEDSARWQRFPRDYTRTTTMGQVVEQGGSWPPFQGEKERERERGRGRKGFTRRWCIDFSESSQRLPRPQG